MEQEKKWWASKTVIASVIGFIAVVLGFLGYDFTQLDQESLIQIITTTIGGTASIFAISGLCLLRFSVRMLINSFKSIFSPKATL